MEKQAVFEVRARILLRVGELAGLAPEGIDPRATFGDLGLDSRAAVQLAGMLSADLRVGVSPTAIWDHPTPERLARHVAGCSAVEETGTKARSVEPRAPVDEPIAIVGMACRFPGARDAEAFFQLLMDGRDGTSEVPSDRWDAGAFHNPDPMALGKTTAPRAGFLDEVDGFDAAFFGISAREAAQMDPQQRLMLELSWEALEDAGIPPEAAERGRAGVYFGVMWNDYATLRERGGPEAIAPHSVVGAHHAFVANRVSYALGLRGPSLSLDTGCSSALVGVSLACDSLRRGESTMALAGAVNLILAPESSVGVTKLGALSPDGECYPFDARANGYVRGEGAGVVVLKPLSRALADGDHIHALVRGAAVGNNGRGAGLTVPSRDAQEELLRAAYERAGVNPREVDFVEAHGTGTLLGDPVEANALGAVLGLGRSAEAPLLVGSHKSSVGHLEAAAGMAGLIKAIKSLEHRELPPSRNFVEANPLIPLLELGLAVPIRPMDLSVKRGPLRAGVSAFGLGGTNAHVVLEEWRPVRLGETRQSGTKSSRPSVWVFSGLGGAWAGMGMSLISEPVFRSTLARCDRVLRPLLGTSVFDLLAAPSARSRLDEVLVACPVTVALEIALAELMRSRGLTPAAVVGHSVGELAAAYVGGALTLEDALRAVTVVGRLTHESGDGALLVVGLGWEEAGELLDGRRDGLVRAIEEGPDATVIGGHPRAIAQLSHELLARRVFARRVDMNGAPHTPIVASSVGELERSLAGLVPMDERCAIYSAGASGRILGRKLGAAYWARWFVEPARFGASLSALAADGYDTFVEVGPHPLLRRAIGETMARTGGSSLVLATLKRDEVGAKTMNETFLALASEVSREVPRAEVLALSAKSPAALSAVRDRFQAFLAKTSASAAAIAHAASTRRAQHDVRIAVVGESRAALAEALERGEIGARPAPSSASGPVLVFAGQGSQWAGMGRELLDEEPVFRQAVTECDELHREATGWSLLAVLRGHDEARSFDDTAVAQPTIFALEIGLARLLGSWGVKAGGVVGHSVGELPAAVVAGAIDLPFGVRAAARRGELMRRATAFGGMIACSMGIDLAHRFLAGAPLLALAAHNDAASVVLSGPEAAIGDAAAVLERQGVEVRPLGVRYAFHHPAMAPSQRVVEDALAELAGRHPGGVSVPFFSATKGSSVLLESFDVEYWAQNLRGPVRFAEAVGAAIDAGHRLFLEIGPRPVLAQHLKRCLEAAGVSGQVVTSLRRGVSDRRALRETLAALFVAGSAIDWHAVHPSGGDCIRLPGHPLFPRKFWLSRTEVALPTRVETPKLGRPLSVATLPEMRLWERHVEVDLDLSTQIEEIARTAAREVLGTADVSIHTMALPVPHVEVGRRLQVSVTPAGTGSLSLNVSSCAEHDAAWTLHGTGMIERRAAASDELWHAVEWRTSIRPSVRRSGALLIVEGIAGAGDDLVERLRASGETIVRVSPGAGFMALGGGCYRACTDRQDGLAAVLRAEFPITAPAVVVVLACLEPPVLEALGRDLEPSDLLTGVAEVLASARAIRRHGYRTAPALRVLTRGARPDAGGAASIAASAVAAIGRVVSTEHPDLDYRSIDLELGVSGAALDDLIHELSAGGAEDQVALRGGARLVARLTRASPIALPASRTLRGDRCYLLTGGLGALGLSLARFLAEGGARHLVLAGPRAPTPEARDAIAKVAALGVRVDVRLLDVASATATRTLVRDLELSEAPLAGVFHLAAVLDDGPLLDLDEGRFARVFAPKAIGAWNLHLATKEISLDHFVLYSSAAVLLGAPGQGNYVAANAFLDALAYHRRTLGLAGVSVAWGPFEDVGMAARSPRRGARLAGRGVRGLSLDDEAAHLPSVLGTRLAHVGVMRFRAQEWFEFYPGTARSPYWSELPSEPRGLPPRASASAAAIFCVTPAERRGVIEERLGDEVARVLGQPRASIDAQAPLTSLGVDSLIGLEILGRVEVAFGVQLTATSLYAHPTLAVLAEHILSLLGNDSPLPSSHGAMSRQHDEIARLSETEAEALLRASLDAIAVGGD